MSLVLPPMARPPVLPAARSNLAKTHPAQSVSWFEQALKRKGRKSRAVDAAEAVSGASPFSLVAGLDFADKAGRAGKKTSDAAIDVTSGNAERKAREDEWERIDRQDADVSASAELAADGAWSARNHVDDSASANASASASASAPGSTSLERLQALCDVIDRLSPQLSFSAARTEMAVSLNHPLLSGVRLRIRAAGPALDVELTSDFAVDADWLGGKANDIECQLTQSLQRPVRVRLVDHLPRAEGAHDA